MSDKKVERKVEKKTSSAIPFFGYVKREFYAKNPHAKSGVIDSDTIEYVPRSMKLSFGHYFSEIACLNKGLKIFYDTTSIRQSLTEEHHQLGGCYIFEDKDTKEQIAEKLDDDDKYYFIPSISLTASAQQKKDAIDFFCVRNHYSEIFDPEDDDHDADCNSDDDVDVSADKDLSGISLSAPRTKKCEWEFPKTPDTSSVLFEIYEMFIQFMYSTFCTRRIRALHGLYKLAKVAIEMGHKFDYKPDCFNLLKCFIHSSISKVDFDKSTAIRDYVSHMNKSKIDRKLLRIHLEHMFKACQIIEVFDSNLSPEETSITLRTLVESEFEEDMLARFFFPKTDEKEQKVTKLIGVISDRIPEDLKDFLGAFLEKPVSKLPVFSQLIESVKYHDEVEAFGTVETKYWHTRALELIESAEKLHKLTGYPFCNWIRNAKKKINKKIDVYKKMMSEWKTSDAVQALIDANEPVRLRKIFEAIGKGDTDSKEGFEIGKKLVRLIAFMEREKRDVEQDGRILNVTFYNPQELAEIEYVLIKFIMVKEETE